MVQSLDEVGLVGFRVETSKSKVWSQRSRSWSCYGCQRLLSNAFFLESRLLEWMCLGNCPRRIKTLFGSTKIACFSLMRFWIVNSSRAETEKPISKSLIGVKQRLHFIDASSLEPVLPAVIIWLKVVILAGLHIFTFTLRKKKNHSVSIL